MDDWDLLEQFRLTRSEQAFGELVRRHAGFVLATCRRRLRDAHLSEDAAQAVFLVLARRPPPRLSTSRATLAGWLYQTAIHACNNAMRANRSRAMHERQAAAEATQLPAVGVEHGIAHAEAEVMLDRALAELSSKERDAILLRYYQDQSVQQVGAALGISQNTATKRIGRAIERMRQFLAGKGLAIASPALVAALSRAMREPIASSEFIAQTVSIGTGQSVASVVVQQLAEGVNSMIRIAQMKLVAGIVIGVITAGGGIIAVNQLFAGDSKPPATQPAKVVSPPSFKADTPKQLLKEFAAAVRKGDPTNLPAMATGDTEEERELMKAAADYVAATGHFSAAVREKFGAEAERELQSLFELTPIGRFCLFIETSVDQAPETIDGNVAMIQPPDVSDLTFWLVNIDGQWKLSTQRMTETWTPEAWRERLGLMQMAAQGLGHFTQAIAAGKYASFAEVKRDIGPILRQNR